MSALTSPTLAAPAGLPSPARGLFAGALHRYAVTVYFEDTDAGGVVYHANYLRWYERARTDMLALLGIDQRAALEAQGRDAGTYVVADLSMRFHAPARLGDAVMIETRLEELRPASVRLAQMAWRGETLLNAARVRVGFVGPDGRARRQPDAWRRAFSSYVQPQPSEPHAEQGFAAHRPGTSEERQQ